MKNWNSTRLKNLLKEPLAYGLNVSSEFADHNMPRYIRITDFDDFNNLNEQTFKSLPIEIAQNALLKDGDLLFARSGASVGKTYLYKQLPNGACYAGYLIKARFNKHVVNPKYVYFLTKSQQYENWKNATYIQATIQNISAEKYYQLPIYLPSIKAQDRIVSYLDTKLSEIDHQVSLLTSKRDAYLRLKKSVINRAVTKGLNPNAAMKDSGVDWIGEIPEGWEVKRGKDCIHVIYGYPADSSKFSDDTGIQLIRIRDINSTETEVKYDGDYPNVYLVHNGDLLIGMDGDFNVAKWRGGEALLNQRVCKLSARNGLVQDFLSFIVGIPLQEINAKKVMTTVKHLSAFDIEQLSIPMPPLSEQRAIATYLDDKCSKIDLIVSNLDKQISKYGDLKRSLIDEVITGKRAV